MLAASPYIWILRDHIQYALMLGIAIADIVRIQCRQLPIKDILKRIIDFILCQSRVLNLFMNDYDYVSIALNQ